MTLKDLESHKRYANKNLSPVQFREIKASGEKCTIKFDTIGEAIRCIIALSYIQKACFLLEVNQNGGFTVWDGTSLDIPKRPMKLEAAALNGGSERVFRSNIFKFPWSVYKPEGEKPHFAIRGEETF